MRRYLTRTEVGLNRLFIASAFLIALLACFAIVKLVTVQLAYERQVTSAQIAQENQNRVRTFEQYVLRTLDLVALTISNARTLGPGRTVEALSRDFAQSSSLITAVAVIRGDVVVSNRSSLAFSAAERRELERLSRQTQYDLWVSKPMKFAAFPRDQIAIVDRSKPGEAVVAVFLEPQSFTQFANQIPFEADDLISLIGLDGVTRARRTGDTLSGGESVKGLVMERQMADPNGSYLGPSVLDGRLRFFSHRRLPYYGLFVTSGRPYALVGERMAHRRSALLVTMAVALLVIIGLALIVIALRVFRQRRLNELLIANRRLSEAQEIGRIGDWDYDYQGDILYWSDQLLAMYGRAPGSNVTAMEDVRKYVKAKDLSMIETALQRVLEGADATWEVDVILDDGSESTRRVNAIPIRDISGNIVGVHGTDQDITAEAKVRDLENKLAEAARLDSMSALAATLAHELNQPLGVATNFVAAAGSTKAAASDPKLSRYLTAAGEQLDHLSQIVLSARELVVHAGASMADVDFTSACAAAISLLKSTTAGRRAYFTTTIEEDLPPIMANEAQVRQVLFNLGKNGIEAVPSERRPQISFRVFRSGMHVQVEVEDNGDGFENFDLDPFAALSTSKDHGLGLGLSLSRTIIEAHGGRIWIDQTGTAGTVVAFTLEAISG